MICPACSLGQRSVQDKAGLRKTYVAGAIVLLPVVLYFFWHPAAGDALTATAVPQHGSSLRRSLRPRPARFATRLGGREFVVRVHRRIRAGRWTAGEIGDALLAPAQEQPVALARGG